MLMRRILCSLVFSCFALAASDKLPYEAALRCLRDQNHEQAFRTYLQTLASSEKRDLPSPKEEERQLYRQALKLYLDGSQMPRDTANQLLQTYSEHVKKHPDFLELSLVVA